MDVDHEIELLGNLIKKLGEEKADGWYVKYGVLFRDEEGEQVFEAIVGTLKAAKKRGLCDFKGQILMSPVHDNVDVIWKK